MFHYRSALDVVLSAAGALWLLSAGSSSVPVQGICMIGNCLGYERQSHYSVFPVIDWWPVGCVLSLAW